MIRVDFTAIAENLPRCEQPHLLAADHEALSQPPEDPEYVIPHFSSEQHWKHPAPPLLVVAAPGAVGKSSLARYLSANRATAMWDLSRLSIGTGTFTGVLTQCFGVGRLASLISDLEAGKALFIFDALDEAEVRSSWPRVAEFLTEVFRASQNAPNIVGVVLARTDTALRIKALFEELGKGNERHALVQLSYFDRDGAHKFVRRRLETRHGRSDIANHKEPFQQALDIVFTQLHAAVSEEAGATVESAHAFVGYAPVLDAVASLLSEISNWTQINARLREALSDSSGRGLLFTILASLLRREHQKFHNACTEALARLGVDSATVSSLYRESEQVQRLSIYTLDKELALLPPPLPGGASAVVAEQLATMLPNHPFLNGDSFAGPAFRDYVLASALLDEDHEQFAEELLRSGSFVPSPLLLRFYAAAGGTGGKASHAGFLHESGIAASVLGEAEFSIGVADDGQEPGCVTLTVDCPSAVPPLQLSLALTHTDTHPLTFRRRLVGASIAVSGKVLLGDGTSFHIQESDVDCDELEISAKDLVVLGGVSGRRSELSARRLIQASPTMSLKVAPPSALAVEWPGAHQHPWLHHRDPQLSKESYDRDGAFFALHRVLKWFRRHKRSEFAKLRKFIDNVVGGRGGGHVMRREMIAHLLTEGLLRIEEPFYTIEPARLEEAGVTWASLQVGTRQASADAFLDRFLAKRSRAAAE